MMVANILQVMSAASGVSRLGIQIELEFNSDDPLYFISLHFDQTVFDFGPVDEEMLMRVSEFFATER